MITGTATVTTGPGAIVDHVERCSQRRSVRTWIHEEINGRVVLLLSQVSLFCSSKHSAHDEDQDGGSGRAWV